MKEEAVKKNAAIIPLSSNPGYAQSCRTLAFALLRLSNRPAAYPPEQGFSD